MGTSVREAASQRRDIVVVGASQGGVEALSQVVAGLPGDLPAAVFVVLHTLPARKSLLPSILSGAGALPAVLAVDGEPLRPGRITIAPPDHHLVLSGDRVRVVHGPKVNGHRPAVDPLFRSAADAFGPRVIGVVLTGGRDCGAIGLQEIRRKGGLALVQDPATAECPEMPSRALAQGRVDHQVALADIPSLLVRLTREVVPEMEERLKAFAAEPMATDAQALTPSDERQWREGSPTDFSCPDCGGVLRQVDAGGKPVGFRCRIGHAMSAETLGDEQESALDLALSAALRALSENADLCRRVARRLGEYEPIRSDYERKASHAEAQAALIRQILLTRHVGAA